MSLQRKIAQLEALATSTTFPAERENALSRAAALRAKLDGAAAKSTSSYYIADAVKRAADVREAWAADLGRRQQAVQAERARAVSDLKAVEVGEDPDRGTLWEVPGEGVLDEQELQEAWYNRLSGAAGADLVS